MLFGRRKKPEIVERMRVALWPRRSWARSWDYARKRLFRLAATPHAIAAGFAAGVFVSFLPIVGFHVVSAAVLAWVTGGSLIAAVIGTFVGNPLTFPLIWGAAFEVGRWVLGDAGAPRPRLDLSEGLLTMSVHTIGPLIKPLMVGGVILGLIAWVLCYFPLRALVAVYQARRRARIAARADVMRPPSPSAPGADRGGGDPDIVEKAP